MLQASNITSVIWDFYKCHMGFVTPAQTNLLQLGSKYMYQQLHQLSKNNANKSKLQNCQNNALLNRIKQKICSKFSVHYFYRLILDSCSPAITEQSVMNVVRLRNILYYYKVEELFYPAIARMIEVPVSPV